MQCKNIADESERLFMTFSGKVKQDMSASILIDSGAAHNFVDASYAKKAKLHVTPETGKLHVLETHLPRSKVMRM